VRTVFVTGAGGFVGSRLVEYLRVHGYDVVAGVRNRARKLAYERNNAKALVCDVTDPINVARAVASIRPDAVVHLAGISRPSDAVEEPLGAYQTIVTAWANILDAVRRTVPRAKIVMASACDVYGNTCGSAPASENTPAAPISTFGSMKAAAEGIAHTFFRDYHLDVTIARPFHYLGAGQPARFFFGAVARQIVEWDAATNGNELSVPDLDCQRDLLHIDDVVSAYERLLADGRPNETYNICSGRATKCRDVVQALVAASGQNLRLTDAQTTASDTQVAVFHGDNSKIIAELSWRPLRTTDDAVRELIASCRTAAPMLAS
jgi:GDP-4-dehydro-6-deoxy-D-mannose reductase